MSLVHISCAGTLGFLTDDDRDLDAHPEYGFCCLGAASGDADDCTCWEPVYTVEQTDDLAIGIEPVTRSTMCDDCAFRPGSPERDPADENYTPGLLDLPHFWCHQGLRAPIEFRHPDGRVRAGHPTQDYRPPTIDGIPYKANGDPADRCAGHAAHAREHQP